jgi:hypothetical protein
MRQRRQQVAEAQQRGGDVGHRLGHDFDEGTRQWVGTIDVGAHERPPWVTSSR